MDPPTALLLSYCISLLFLSCLAATFSSDWQSATRLWHGPDWWANPLQDWSLIDGHATSRPATDRTLCLTSFSVVRLPTSRRPAPTDPLFELSVQLSAQNAPALPRSPRFRAGFRIGRRGHTASYLAGLIDAVSFIDATLSADGSLAIADAHRKQVVKTSFTWTRQKSVRLTLRAYHLPGSSTARLELDGPSNTARMNVNASDLLGGVSLLTDASASKPRPTDPVLRFANVSFTGPAVKNYAKTRRLGPLLWTQYTLSGGELRLQAQMTPVEKPGRSVFASLWVRPLGSSADHEKLQAAKMDPVARTVTFSVPGWDSSRAVEFEVRTTWQGRPFERTGVVRAEPPGTRLKIGVFSCDFGYLFPQKDTTAAVRAQSPHMLFFAGDQIYEGSGSFEKALFEPVDIAVLEYLRKFYAFGLAWRGLLRDRPAIIIPDDHDVFHGNLFGQGGRSLPLPLRNNPRSVNDTAEKNRLPGSFYKVDLDFGRGGYLMPGKFVAAVERTQTGHLPRPARPDIKLPIGIGTYFTAVRYANVSIAVLEDRKFKTGSSSVSDAARQTGAGGELLGPDQEAFLREWADDWSGHVLKMAVSQTIFCKVHTHGGRESLKRVRFGPDSGGWPIAARNRAVEILARANALTLHGDIHLGALVRMHDGSQRASGRKYIHSLVVPGTANEWSRAWWPNGRNGTTTGRYTDDLGHDLTVLGAANLDPGSHDYSKLSPSDKAFLKGSGYGMVTVDTAEKTAKVEIFRVGGG